MSTDLKIHVIPEFSGQWKYPESILGSYRLLLSQEWYKNKNFENINTLYFT